MQSNSGLLHLVLVIALQKKGQNFILEKVYTLHNNCI